jgi:hypothetical protein
MDEDGIVHRLPPDVQYPIDLVAAELFRLVVLWALIGMYGGILVGMIFLREGSAPHPISLAFYGFFIGTLLGLGAQAICKWNPEARLFLTASSVVILSVAIGAMIGFGGGEWGMLVGAGIGLFFGLPVGTAHVILQAQKEAMHREQFRAMSHR